MEREAWVGKVSVSFAYVVPYCFAESLWSQVYSFYVWARTARQDNPRGVTQAALDGLVPALGLFLAIALWPTAIIQGHTVEGRGNYSSIDFNAFLLVTEVWYCRLREAPEMELLTTKANITVRLTPQHFAASETLRGVYDYNLNRS